MTQMTIGNPSVPLQIPQELSRIIQHPLQHDLQLITPTSLPIKSQLGTLDMSMIMDIALLLLMDLDIIS
jgi:hypothetical protein